MSDEHAMLQIAGYDAEVVSVDGHEAVSELFRLDVVCRVPDTIPAPKELAGQTVTMDINDGFGKTRSITAVVAEAERLAYDDGTRHLRLVLRPRAYMLTLGRGCRVFQDMSVVEIVDTVLGDLPHRWEVSSSYETHVYCVQYREDDWTYISRWLEREGIYYWFDHENGSQLVLGDDSTAAADLAGGAYIPFQYDTGMVAAHEVVVQLGSSAAVAPTKFSVGSFDPNRPNLKVSGSVGEGPLEIYEAPGGGPESPDECARQATLMSQAAAAAGAGVSGEAWLARLCHGRVLEVGEHPLDRLNGRYYITEVRFRIRQRSAAGAEETPFQCHFQAIDVGVPYRAPSDTPRAEQAGLQSGIVVGPGGEEIHTDETGRVRVQLHWDREGARDETGGKWMRVAQRGSNDSMLLPRIGWNVLTFNDEGAVDAPSVLSRIFDAEHPPTYALPANKTRVVFKTATSPADGSHNEIYYEDTAGAEEMFMNASRDMNVLTQHVKTETIERDCVRTVGANRDLEVVADYNERIMGDQSTSVGSNETATVVGDREKEVRGSESIVIGGARKITTGEGHSIAVTNNRSLSVSAVMLDNSLGTISGESDVITQMIGGVVLRATPNSVTEDAGAASIQLVGGAKLEFTDENRGIDAATQYIELVGGLLFCKTDGTYLDDSRLKASWSVGALMSSTAPDLWIEAEDKIEISCGGSSFVILPDSIEISGVELALSNSDSLEVITKKVEHN